MCRLGRRDGNNTSRYIQMKRVFVIFMWFRFNKSPGYAIVYAVLCVHLCSIHHIPLIYVVLIAAAAAGAAVTIFLYGFHCVNNNMKVNEPFQRLCWLIFRFSDTEIMSCFQQLLQMLSTTPVIWFNISLVNVGLYEYSLNLHALNHCCGTINPFVSLHVLPSSSSSPSFFMP